MDRVPVAVVVLTRNEAVNIAACVRSVTEWAAEVFVVDSGSTDGTDTIAATLGATVVTHPFENHVQQWQWALRELPLQARWVLALDADQRVTPALAQSIREALGRGGDVAGWFVNRRQIFRGRWIRYGGYYPKFLLKLFRREAVWLDAADLVDHHFRVHGPTARLRGDLIEDNGNDARIADWIARHTRYAYLQACEEVAGDAAAAGAGLSGPDARTWRQKRIWRRLPRYVRPAAYFFYRYVLRLGFLDGKQGFVFHALQGFWYRLLVDIHIDEIRAIGGARAGDRR